MNSAHQENMLYPLVATRLRCTEKSILIQIRLMLHNEMRNIVINTNNNSNGKVQQFY